MKRIAILLLLVFLVSLIPASAAFAGNGAPSGSHYNLNIIGVSNPKTADMTDTSRHTIFVDLQGRCNISLGEGEFQVLDGNCFDGVYKSVNGVDMKAAFQLPSPDADSNGWLDYSAWVRVPGNRDGEAQMATCIYDPDGGGQWCSTGFTINRTLRSKFTDVSKDLLTVCAYQETGQYAGTYRYEALFADDGADYWWQYDNNGLKIAQFRFYQGTSGGFYDSPCTR